MKKYICIIESNSSFPREYEVETSSAMKCANELGRLEGGETVTVYNKSKSKVIGRVKWSPEIGYYRVVV